MSQIKEEIEKFLALLSQKYRRAEERRAIHEMVFTLLKSKIRDGEKIERTTYENVADMVYREDWKDPGMRLKTKNMLDRLRNSVE